SGICLIPVNASPADSSIIGHDRLIGRTPRSICTTRKSEHAMTTPKILVKDYMRPLAVTFSPRSRVEEVVEGLLQHRVTGAPVIDDQQKLVGFVSEQDCIKEMLNDSYYGQDHQLAEDVMRTNVLFATPDTDIMQLAEKM